MEKFEQNRKKKLVRLCNIIYVKHLLSFNLDHSAKESQMKYGPYCMAHTLMSLDPG